MSSYEERFEVVRVALISYCKQCIRDNWDRMFDMWLVHDADMEFGDGYQDKFKEQYRQYMNPQIEEQLWLAGKHIVFAINAFMSYKDDANCNDVIDFTEKFVSEQLNDFDNWCDDIRQSMFEETSEYEREFGNRNNDNPS